MTTLDDLLNKKKPPEKKKIPYLKYALIGIPSIGGLFFLVAILWVLYFNAQFSVYQDDHYKFSIEYPKTWQVVVHPRENVPVAFLRPKETALDPLQENFNVTVQPLPVGVFDLDEFSNKVKAQMIAVFGSSVIFVEYKPVHWGLRNGYRLSIEAPKPDNLRMINVWTLNDNQSYILTFLGNIDKYPKDSIVVNKMIRSLKFL